MKLKDHNQEKKEGKGELAKRAMEAATLGAQAVLTAHSLIAGLIGNHLHLSGLGGLDKTDLLVVHTDKPLKSEAIEALSRITAKPILCLPVGASINTLSSDQLLELGFEKRAGDIAPVVALHPAVSVELPQATV
jgi:hypothetical protein